MKNEIDCSLILSHTVSMDHPVCRTCNTKHRLGAIYCPALKSRGGAEVRRAKAGNKLGSVPRAEMSSFATSIERATVRGAAIQPCAGVTPGPREFRRPLAKDAAKTISRQKPWEAEGISRASWYRRRLSEQREKQK
jgi:hypothetical protein